MTGPIKISHEKCTLHEKLFCGDGTVKSSLRLTREIVINDATSNALMEMNVQNIRTFFRDNPTLIKLGGNRSVENTYLKLWSMVYDSRFYGCCKCEDANDGSIKHVSTNLATYPRLTQNWENELIIGKELTEYIVIDKVSSIKESSSQVARITSNPLDENQTLLESIWFCDATVVLKRPAISVTKLIDRQHEEPRDVWRMIGNIMAWSDDVFITSGQFPVRRCLWDLLIINGIDIVPCTGLSDIGDIQAFVFSVRVLILIFYLGCCYGGISRTLLNERISNKRHECLLPPKSPGVYHSLFATSKIPHRLICGHANGKISGEAFGEITVKNWLSEFRGLYDRACERYGIASHHWRFLDDYLDLSIDPYEKI